jgi:hypothetical protein
VTGNTVSSHSATTIENREPMTITYPQIIHILTALGLTVGMDILICMSDNEDVSNQRTKLAGRSNSEIQDIVHNSGSNVPIWIANYS